MPENWKSYKFSELFETASGLSKSRDQFGFGSPFLTFKDVFYNYFLPAELGDLANTSEKEQKRGSVKRGDIFLTRTSETLHELGMSSVALKDYPNSTFNGFCKRLRQKKSSTVKIHPEFIGYFLRSNSFRNEISQHATMTTRASLNNTSINSLSVTLPTFPEQVEIGEILKTLDDKIELNLQMNKTLEEMAMALYKHWFVDFEHFQNEEFIDVEFFGINRLLNIPDKFEVVNLKEIINRFKSKNKYSQKNVFPEGKVRVFDQSSSRILGFHDNEPDFEVTFNVPFLIFGDHTCRMELVSENFSVGPNLIPFKPKNPELTYLMYLSLVDKVKMNDYKRHWSELMLHQLVIPKDLNVVKKFNAHVRDNFSLIYQHEIEIQTLTQLRDTLLPKLISGEVRVKDAEKTLSEVL